MSLRGGGRFHGRQVQLKASELAGTGSGGDGAADGDAGGGGAGGGAASGGGERLPGLGLVVAVPVTVGRDRGACPARAGRLAPGRGACRRAGWRWRCRRGGGDGGAAGGGEGDLPSVTGCPARRPLLAGAAPGAAAAATARTSSTAVIQRRAPRGSSPGCATGRSPVDGPAPDGGLVLAQRGLRPVPAPLIRRSQHARRVGGQSSRSVARQNISAHPGPRPRRRTR